jgi:glutamate-1-semialdehyde 2,1-aminomutase
MDNRVVFEKWRNRAADRFKKRTQESAKIFEKAQKYLPGGDTRTVTYFYPYPAYIEHGAGCKLYDVDGNEYIDFLNQYTALVHGHSHPAIEKAVSDQARLGLSFSAPTENQVVLAGMICDRVNSVEQIRFCNSGTEATMNAIRAARIFTGRSKIVKMEGAYHGSHDLAEVSLMPPVEKAGPISRPYSFPAHRGIPTSILDEVIVAPFNNKQVTEKIIREHSKDIACVIIEVITALPGLVLPMDGFLELVRDLTQKLNIVLIFDEVVTFRISKGGAQEIYGIKPDLTTFGKLIGGGLPIGAFGGSREIMKIFSPLERNFISHSGTFNANPVTMAAGIACLQELTVEEIKRINSLGDRLRQRVDSILAKNGVAGQALGFGSLGQIHINKEKIVDYRTAAKGNFQALALLHLELLGRGINMAPRGGEIAISTPMTDKEIDLFVTAFEESLTEIRPFIKETSPELIS